MQNNIKSKQKGFTIIEVLIVIAIAGLIMVVVFLAVPALRRNANNNALSTNVNNIASGVANYMSNNNGKVPADGSIGLADSKVTIGAAGTNQEVVNVDASVKDASKGAAATTANGVGAVRITFGAKCNAEGTGVESAGTSNRSYAATYVAEGSGNDPIVKCVGS